MSLEDLRKRIDAIDERIVRLLDLRFRYALRTRRFKTTAEDPGREREVLRSVSRKAGRLAGPEFAVRIYQEILAESKELQRKTENLNRRDHEDRHPRSREDGKLAGPGARPGPRRRRP